MGSGTLGGEYRPPSRQQLLARSANAAAIRDAETRKRAPQKKPATRSARSVQHRWECPTCTKYKVNDGSDEECTVCGTPKEFGILLQATAPPPYAAPQVGHWEAAAPQAANRTMQAPAAAAPEAAAINGRPPIGDPKWTKLLARNIDKGATPQGTSRSQAPVR